MNKNFMFCPVCSQQQVSDETRFCSRCGFLLTGVSQVIANGGLLPYLPAAGGDPNALSPRQKGIRQGAALLFSSFIIVPILVVITIALQVQPFAVVAGLFLTFVAGILRMLYAFLFESKTHGTASQSVLPESFQNVLPSKKQVRALPQQQSPPVSAYVPPAAGAAGNWRDTNDLVGSPPPSVTDPTTKLLQNDE